LTSHARHARNFLRPTAPGLARSILLPVLRIAIPLLTVLSNVHAEDARTSPQVWLNAGFLSWHFERDEDLRGTNWGWGVEVVLTPDHAAMVGNYINSDGDRSNYAAYQWRPLHWRPYGIDVSAGVAIGAFDGYQNVNDGGWYVVPVPLLAVEGRRLGANFTIVPTIDDKVHGAIVVQLKLRVW
jgi:hypothetical protein